MLRHVEAARHTTPGSQAKGGGVRHHPLLLLSLLSEYMLLGLFLALPQHWSQRLGLGEVQLRRNKKERWKTKRWWCVRRTPELVILGMETF